MKGKVCKRALFHDTRKKYPAWDSP
jgi:hypothetical protein